MAKKNKKKNNYFQATIDKNKYNMKVVTSGTCQVCKTQCERGLQYLEKMEKPGAVGHGVPCVLTKGKAYK